MHKYKSSDEKNQRFSGQRLNPSPDPTPFSMRKFKMTPRLSAPRSENPTTWKSGAGQEGTAGVEGWVGKGVRGAESADGENPEVSSGVENRKGFSLLAD